MASHLFVFYCKIKAKVLCRLYLVAKAAFPSLSWYAIELNATLDDFKVSVTMREVGSNYCH